MSTAPGHGTEFGSALEFATVSSVVSPRPQVSRTITATCASLLRQVYRATHRRDQWHSERLWPHTRISRDADGRLEEMRFGRRQMRIANHSGSDALKLSLGNAVVHLIASGPSISDIDYSALRLGNVLGVNGAIALASRHSVKFTHYCITDTGFLRNRPDLVATILSQDLLLFTTPVALTHILHHFPYDKIRCRIFLLERVGEQALRPREPAESAITHANGNLTLFDSTYGLGFSHDIRRGIFPGGTVAYEALQILSWLGFRQIYLHGIDLSNADHAPRFYENEENKLPCHLTKQLERVINDIFPIVDWRSLIQNRDGADRAS